ncbi:hypothetical protein N658DRAFT_501065 [Parathielavia hyrcaniae]|uniref:Uncharacterized protein n=1 Tax=Parathielavia hyrcaniae TaxID=113614 RepID=A0AAN6PTQ9_9PEZI|nr:hypothetical protein N658DRAFT_501065 [Parathielavia hyrcaniae]
MQRHPERLHLAAWAGPERGYRPQTPYPGFEEPKRRSRYYEMHTAESWARHRYVDATRYRHSEDFQRRIDEQNAKFAERPPRAQGRYFEPERSAPKRVRFSLPPLRRDQGRAG